MPSPKGTNREKLYILQGGRGVLNPSGAYDSRRGLAYDTLGASPEDNVAQIAAWAKENMSSEDLMRLCKLLGDTAGTGSVPAADDNAPPSVDPMETRGRAPGARVSMDSAQTKSLFARFPDLARIGVGF
jgi:hypothetical protein